MSLVSVQSSNLPERSVVEETAAIVASLTNSTCQAAAATGLLLAHIEE